MGKTENNQLVFRLRNLYYQLRRSKITIMGIRANNSDAHFHFMGNDIYSKKIKTRLEFAHEIIKLCLKGGYKCKQQNLN